VLRPTPQRDPTVDLLLCGHHYRLSRLALTSAAALVFNPAGALISSPATVVQDTAHPRRIAA
jgi:hypothetical protein